MWGRKWEKSALKQIWAARMKASIPDE